MPRTLFLMLFPLPLLCSDSPLAFLYIPFVRVLIALAARGVVIPEILDISLLHIQIETTSVVIANLLPSASRFTSTRLSL